MIDKDAYNCWPKRMEEYALARINLERRARQLADALLNFWPTSTGLILPLEGFTHFDHVNIRVDSVEVWYFQPWSEGSSDFIEFSAQELDEPIEVLQERAYLRSWVKALEDDKRQTEVKTEQEQRERKVYERLKEKFDPGRRP